MTDNNPDDGWWFNTRTNEVEHGNLAKSIDRLGPYPDRATAARALDIARERTQAADKADRAWSGDDD
ncbi:hypothetical protein [Actinokineospora sp. NBRC 105648]|uniref:hypothetical protein n=1 Tax=Actinokineospora sp. NBRC 105648 TaxID=3032206 RepID=UPI0024A1EB28|nr:hypothetical protein [Actinokineospora sp. NBRC 105648]GLZ43687.1 hypothetical protein Acsp05_73110 [Actinokineospora sp. NBRC 105648]